MYSCKTKCNKNSEFIKTHGDLKKKIELERPKKSQDGKGRSQEKSWAEDLGNNQTEAKRWRISLRKVNTYVQAYTHLF